MVSTIIVISSRCKYSTDLLQWLVSSKHKTSDVLIITLESEKGQKIKKQIKNVPALIATGTNDIQYGVENIMKYFSPELFVPQKEELSIRPDIKVDTNKKLQVVENYMPVPVMITNQELNVTRPKKITTLDTGSYYSLLSDFNKPMGAAGITYESNKSTCSGRRDKMSNMEQSLESLIASRKSVGSGIKRI